MFPLFRLIKPDFHPPGDDLLIDEDDDMRVVISAPDRDLTLEMTDIAFMLVQYEPEGGEQDQ